MAVLVSYSGKAGRRLGEGPQISDDVPAETSNIVSAWPRMITEPSIADAIWSASISLTTVWRVQPKAYRKLRGLCLGRSQHLCRIDRAPMPVDFPALALMR